MNLKATLSNFVHNRWVLNIVAVLAIFNFIGYIVLGETNLVLFGIVVGLLVRYFTENMVYVLGAPLLLVNLLATRSLVEGMETKSSKDEKKDTPKEESIEEEDDSDDNEVSPSNAERKVKSGFEVGRRKSANGTKIDYATTIEEAYDDLNKILGSDGIKNLTDDTQRLMKQQAKLAESMEAMTPVIEKMMPLADKANEMLKGMDKNSGGMEGIMQMAKKMSSSMNLGEGK